VNECQPLPTYLSTTLPSAVKMKEGTSVQGLTRVHFSAQRKPFLIQNTP